MFGREVFKHLSAWKADFVTSLERRKIPNELSGNYLFAWKRINSQTTNLLNIPLFLADKTKELLAMQISVTLLLFSILFIALCNP